MFTLVSLCCVSFPQDKTGQFLQLIIYTSLTLLTLQCFMQIPFAYVPPHGKNCLPAKITGWKIRVLTFEIGLDEHWNLSKVTNSYRMLFVCFNSERLLGRCPLPFRNCEVWEQWLYTKCGHALLYPTSIFQAFTEKITEPKTLLKISFFFLTNNRCGEFMSFSVIQKPSVKVPTLSCVNVRQLDGCNI